jgi:hypothetical protein
MNNQHQINEQTGYKVSATGVLANLMVSPKVKKQLQVYAREINQTYENLIASYLYTSYDIAESNGVEHYDDLTSHLFSIEFNDEPINVIVSIQDRQLYICVVSKNETEQFERDLNDLNKNTISLGWISFCK